MFKYREWAAMARRNVALLLLMIATVAAAAAFNVGGATANPNEPASVPTSDPTATQEDLVDGDGMPELTELRTRFSRTFEAPDGPG